MRDNYDPDNPRMLNSAVCFIDILGFSNMINEACKSNTGNDLLLNIYNSINNSIQYIKPSSHGVGNIKIFTDNIVIGIPIYQDGESELGQILSGFSSYQLSLALDGFFVRGGITVGDYYSNKYISYGPSLIEAHNLENCLADTPRIVLSDSAKQLVRKHINYYADPIINAPQVNYIYKDIDGEWFINYLAAIDVNENPYAYNLVKKHKDVIEASLVKYQGVPRVYKKYVWAAQYHNFFCSEYFRKHFELQIENISSGISYIIGYNDQFI